MRTKRISNAWPSGHTINVTTAASYMTDDLIRYLVAIDLCPIVLIPCLREEGRIAVPELIKRKLVARQSCGAYTDGLTTLGAAVLAYLRQNGRAT